MNINIKLAKPVQSTYTGNTMRWPPGLYVPADPRSIGAFVGLFKGSTDGPAITLTYFNEQAYVNDSYIQAPPGSILEITV